MFVQAAAKNRHNATTIVFLPKALLPLLALGTDPPFFPSHSRCGVPASESRIELS
jgi:hypothetical protein